MVEPRVSGISAFAFPRTSLPAAACPAEVVGAAPQTNARAQALSPSVTKHRVPGKPAVALPGPALPTATEPAGVVRTAFGTKANAQPLAPSVLKFGVSNMSTLSFPCCTFRTATKTTVYVGAAFVAGCKEIIVTRWFRFTGTVLHNHLNSLVIEKFITHVHEASHSASSLKAFALTTHKASTRRPTYV